MILRHQVRALARHGHPYAGQLQLRRADFFWIGRWDARRPRRDSDVERVYSPPPPVADFSVGLLHSDRPVDTFALARTERSKTCKMPQADLPVSVLRHNPGTSSNSDPKKILASRSCMFNILVLSDSHLASALATAVRQPGVRRRARWLLAGVRSSETLLSPQSL